MFYMYAYHLESLGYISLGVFALYLKIDMDLFIIPFLFLIPLIFLFVKHLTSKPRTKLNLPPGPKPNPIVGNLYQVEGIPHVYAYNLFKIYGPIVYMRMGRIPYIIVSTPTLVEEILRKQDLNFCSPPHLTVMQKYSFNGCDVGAAPYGDKWRHLRKIFTLELLGSQKLAFFRSARLSEVDRMIQYIRTRPDHNSPVNISNLMVRLSSSIICRVAFGLKTDGGYGDRTRFHDLLDEGNALSEALFMADYFPGFGWIDWLTGNRTRLERNVKELNEFYDRVIEEHMDVANRGEDYEEDFVDVMIRLCKEEGSKLTNDHIKGAIMDALVAASDTSGSTMTWGMTELVRNPRVMKKAQDEIRSVIGDKGKVEEDDLPLLEYLNLVVYETLRLHQAFTTPREAMNACKLDGYDIPKGTRVFINSWALSRDENNWENALEFEPERFSGSSVSHLGNDFRYIPFGAGRRACPGMNFGMANVRLTLANLLYAFNWELPSGTILKDIDVDEAPGSVVHKKNHLILVPQNKQ